MTYRTPHGRILQVDNFIFYISNISLVRGQISSFIYHHAIEDTLCFFGIDWCFKEVKWVFGIKSNEHVVFCRWHYTWSVSLAESANGRGRWFTPISYCYISTWTLITLRYIHFIELQLKSVSLHCRNLPYARRTWLKCVCQVTSNWATNRCWLRALYKNT